MKILLWNLQDFFVFLDKHDQTMALDPRSLSESSWQLLTTSFKTNKSLDKTIEIANLIRDEDPDICLFTEVGGKESLSNLNQYFLDNKYVVLHAPSNSDRGIDLGILKRKDLPHKQFIFHNNSVYSRGVAELKIDCPPIKLSLLLTHLKSKLNKDGADFEGRTKRALEVKSLVSLAKKRQGQDYEVVICGDLNGVIYEDKTEPELSDFANKLGLYDLMDYQKRPYFERATYFYYNKRDEIIPMQLDYFLLSKKLFSMAVNDSGVKDFSGLERTIFPTSKKEKFVHPSDHYPLIVNLKLKTKQK